MKRKYEGEKINMERGESMRFSETNERTKKTKYEKQEKMMREKLNLFRQCKKMIKKRKNNGKSRGWIRQEEEMKQRRCM